jgi:hypothetical protein
MGSGTNSGSMNAGNTGSMSSGSTATDTGMRAARADRN